MPGTMIRMALEGNEITFSDFTAPVIVIVGSYGSGKSEIAVNLARRLVTSQGDPVAIADLDIINPYFRSRESAAGLTQLGVTCLTPPGPQLYADLPVIIPEIKTAIERANGIVILDVGGDDAGARVLRSLADAFHSGRYEMLLVLNNRRPFTANVDGACRMLDEIETASGLRFTGLIANSHLLTETTPEIIAEGISLSEEVSRRRSLPIRFISGLAEQLEQIPGDQLPAPVLALSRALVKPWEHKGPTWTDPKLRIR